MNPIVMFLVKLLVSSGLLLLFYFAMFRGKASFRASRAFLVAIPLLGLVFSLVTVEGGRGYSFSSVFGGRTEADLPAVVAEQVGFAPLAVEVAAVEVAAVEPVVERVAGPVGESASVVAAVDRSYRSERGGFPFVAVVYVLCVAILAGVIGRQMVALGRLRRRARRQVAGGCTVYFSSEIRSAFSVLRSIYVNDGTSDEKLAIIIRHEAQHIVNRHYLDLTVMELFTVVMWFNPMVWIARRELRSVHEFEADRGTLDTGVGMRDYMLTILEEVTGIIPVMANGLKSSMIKKRFQKMKTENRIRLRGLRAILTVPFATAVAMFFALEPATGGETGDQVSFAVSQQTPLPGGENYTAGGPEITHVTVDLPVEIPAQDENALQAETALDNNAVFQAAEMGVVAGTAGKTMLLPGVDAAPAPRIESRLEPQEQQGPRSLKIVVRDRRGRPVTGNDVQIGINGSGVLLALDQNGSRTFSITDDDSIVLATDEKLFDLPTQGLDSIYVIFRNRNRISFRIPGKKDSTAEDIEVGFGTITEHDRTTAVGSLEVENAENYTDLKGYLGGRIPGIWFKGDEVIVRGMGSVYGSNAALVVVDGIITSFGDVNRALSPSEVASVSVLKDSSAAIYGAQGANGVVLIITKGAKSTER